MVLFASNLSINTSTKVNFVSFKNLNLPNPLTETLEETGLTVPTPIQQQAIPEILNGKDVLASAGTGTGKTAAYLLPALCRLLTASPVKAIGPRILVLVPTRELAMQVAAEAVRFSQNMRRAKTVCIYGGAPYPIQNRQLSSPYDILVATPGRLIDHIQRGRINFSRLEMLILDEADRMLDMGFIEPVKQIAALTPKTRQTLLFSATLKGNVIPLSKDLLIRPIEISVETEQVNTESIEQRLHYTDNLGHKNKILNHILSDPTINQVIVFTSTKRHAEQLVDELYDQGYLAAALHGDMNQGQRSKTIKRLRQGEIKILVATDIAARGIDVPTISHVVNFDLPRCVEDYVHRIGRTGRAGESGVALSLASNSEAQLVKRIEKFTGKKITPHVIPSLEPKMQFKSYPRSFARRSR